jgi:LPXTG-motif cell wall-anchored protein
VSPSPKHFNARTFAAGAAIAALSVFGVVAVPMSASAATIAVTTIADSGAGSLRAAIVQANGTVASDTITFDPAFIPANSVIELDTRINITENLVIDGSAVSGLTVAGGDLGDSILFFVAPATAGRSFEFSNFIIDGTAGVGGWTGTGIYSSTGVTGDGALNLTLDGMTARNITGPVGSAFNVFTTDVAGTVTISDSTFENNTATAAGGGALFLRGVKESITVTNSTFDGNVANANGGGAIFIDGQGGGLPSLSVAGSTFASNIATAGNSGGAIFANVLASASITNSEFTENVSSLAGGAVAFGSIDLAGFFDVLNSVFDSNVADASGGAVYIDDSPAETLIENNTFVANQADGVDGGALAFGSVSNTLSIFSNTFTQNLAPAARGGVSISIVSIVADTIVAIGNCTFLEQDTDNGAVIGVTTSVEPGGELFIVSSTLLGMGAIYLEQNDGQVTISNSIIDGDVNSLGFDTVDLAGGSVVGIEWSVVADAFDGATMLAGNGNQFSTAALLGPLQDNGGPTDTMALLANSPAINAGDPSYIYPFTEDQRGAGFARIVAGTVDIGAFEAAPSLAATGNDINPMVPIGASALVLLGIAALVFSRRRRAA